MSRTLMGAAVVAALLNTAAPAMAQTGSQSEIAVLKAQMAQMQERLNQLEQAKPPVAAPAQATATNSASAFNPAIGVVLNGHYGSFTGNNADIAGFGVGEEGGRAAEGLALDEAELNISSNVDDKFAASVTAAIAEEDGETEVELEEAYIRTLGLPGGLGVKAGRFLAPVGYLNERHAHSDDFADRPLPNRTFLNSGYKDDGVLASVILPTDFYSEIGAGVVRGNDFPGGGSDGSDPGAWMAYGKVGGDIDADQSWLVGLSTLQTRPGSRAANDDTVFFHGDSNLYVASLRYTWNPTGNAKDQEVSLQGEYFWRDENGTYEDTNAGTGAVDYDDAQSGWYAQAVYKFLPEWRVGARYSMLNPGDVPAGLAGSALDDEGHKPWNAALMTDWTNSEFSRIRLQYAYEEPSSGEEDNQVLLQYIMSFGAHPAHTY